MIALDLYCGAGGASLGLDQAGWTVVGVDANRHAVASHRANGLPAVEGYITTEGIVDGDRIGRWDDPDAIEVDLLWASPPCQPFSQGNGNAQGRDDKRDGFPAVLAAMEHLRPRLVIIENVRALSFPKHRPYLDEIMLQIKRLGYDAEWRVLNAADYGVPQTRQRTFIVARLDGAPVWPAPTHSKEGVDTARWISMANALGRDDLPAWAQDRPSTTVVGSFKPEMQAPPTWRKAGDGPRQNQPEAVRTTLAERLVLMGFPSTYTLVGPKTATDLQVGNAVCPPLASALASCNRPLDIDA